MVPMDENGRDGVDQGDEVEGMNEDGWRVKGLAGKRMRTASLTS